MKKELIFLKESCKCQEAKRASLSGPLLPDHYQTLPRSFQFSMVYESVLLFF